VALIIGALVVASAAYIWYAQRPSEGHPSTYTPRDASLRVNWLYFYPVRDAPAQAIIFLFGNDVAFWGPHQELAWRLSGEGYTVVGIDMRKFLNTLPAAEPARDSTFGPAIASVMARSRKEMRADSLPVVIGGHSFGAELAFWVALHRPPPRLVGVLSLNTRSTGHLFITPGDLLNHEASGPWSFSVIDIARELPPDVRIALVRSAHDPFRKHDSAFVAAGGARLRRYEVPFAGHSMRSLLVAGPLIARAVHFLVDTSSH
jgi:pimeloyl-ACP methyl ester carboxylesterase